MRKIFLLGMILIFSFSATSLAADVSGKWLLNFPGPMGPEEWKLDITQTGETLDIACEHPMFGPVKGEGKSKGDAVSLKFVLDTPMGVMTILMPGTVSGGSMKGEASMNEAPMGAWDAAKK